jgi:hypothetical protein
MLGRAIIEDGKIKIIFKLILIPLLPFQFLFISKNKFLRHQKMKKRIIPFLLLTFVLSEKDYFQQHVAYDISVELDDKAHTLSAYEKIIYTNNSPDTLNFIWFHLWPNAYKNDSSALGHRWNQIKFRVSGELLV